MSAGMRYLISGTSLGNAKSLAGSLGRTLLSLNSASSTPHAWHIISRRADQADALTRQLDATRAPDLQSTFNSLIHSSLTLDHVADIAMDMQSTKATGLVLLPDAIDVAQWDETETLLAAAKAANLEHVMLISTYASHPAAIIPSGKAWAALEEKAAEMDLPLSVVRPTTLMQSMLFGNMKEMISGRNLSVSMDHARVAYVHAQDVAEVVNHMMAAPTKDATPVDLTGPAALSWDEIASTLSKYVEAPKVHLTKVPLWVVQPSMWIRGKNPDEINEVINSSKYFEAGGEATVCSSVADILGRPPLTFDAFVAAHKDEWLYEPPKKF
ncbi:Aste57867_24395 [Aphanomyces stellatus]|uniref:Aste57867_24395 protein n=1 Tax=Aphanomyces stellatus TaxID=120398 RepID=A0A485LRW4_9STRA|nr:hypothetical protein As57867_024319 [Aphanomyces stellatus]VFU01035.1 Aste57867_24395 [Aphanomyces stellatus]